MTDGASPAAARTSDDAKTRERPIDFKTRLAIRLGGWLLRILGATWRIQVHGREQVKAHLATGQGVVYLLWHGQMLPILYAHKEWTGVMISEHRDGEIIAQVVEMFGAFAFRGSTSRGGTRALLEGVKLVRSGVNVAITPDGPRGPRHSFAPGALLLAFRAEVPVCAITAHVHRAWQLNSWDAFTIPKPFSRVTIVYGTPKRVVASDAREAASLTDRYAAYMHETTARAMALGRGQAAPDQTP